jgi:hypothetical protein
MATLGELDVIALLGRDQLTIAFDTNAIFETRKAGEQDKDPFVRVCNGIIEINRIRGAPSDRPFIRKVLPASVYVEKLHDLRQQFGKRYDHNKILGFLQSKGIEVVSFDQCHAEHIATILGRLYPDDDAWQAFKKQLCAGCLGLSPTARPGTGGAGRRSIGSSPATLTLTACCW